MRDHRGVAGVGGHLHGFQGFGEGADLVDLDQDRIGDAAFDAALQALAVGDEQVVADQLDLIADGIGEQLPAGPIVFGHAIFDGENRRILADPVGPELHHLFAGAFALVGLLEDVLAILEEFAGGGVEADSDVHAGLVAGLRDGFEAALDGFFVGFQHGGEAALVADGSGVAFLAEHLFEGMEDLDAHAQGFAEALGAEGRDHEFLRVHRIIGMRAAVDDVHHGHWQGVGADSAEVAIKRSVLGRGGRAGGGHGDGQNGVGAEASFVGRAIERDHRAIDFALLGGVLAVQRGGDFAVDVFGCVQAAFAQIAGLVAIAEFHGFMLAGGCAGRHCGPAHTAVCEIDIRFHSRIPAGIQNLSSKDTYDRRQSIAP